MNYLMHGRQWSSRSAAYAYARQEGFHVGRMICRECHAVHDAVIETPDGYNPYACECRQCGCLTAYFDRET